MSIGYIGSTGRLLSVPRSSPAFTSPFLGAGNLWGLRIPRGIDYNGALIRVQRSSDLSEIDIGWLDPDTNGNRWLDTASILAHIAAWNGTSYWLGAATGYTVSAATFTPNGAGAERHTFIENTATSGHLTQKVMSVTEAGRSYRVTVTVSRTGPANRDIMMQVSGGLLAYRLETGVVQQIAATGVTGLSGTITPTTLDGNPAWALTYNFTRPAGGGQAVVFTLAPAGGTGDNRSYTGDGLSGFVMTTPVVWEVDRIMGAAVSKVYNQLGSINQGQYSTIRLPAIAVDNAITTKNGRPAILCNNNNTGMAAESNVFGATSQNNHEVQLVTAQGLGALGQAAGYLWTGNVSNQGTWRFTGSHTQFQNSGSGSSTQGTVNIDYVAPFVSGQARVWSYLNSQVHGKREVRQDGNVVATAVNHVFTANPLDGRLTIGTPFGAGAGALFAGHWQEMCLRRLAGEMIGDAQRAAAARDQGTAFGVAVA